MASADRTVEVARFRADLAWPRYDSGMSAHTHACPESCNVLLIGGGGREHALAWKLRQSPRCGTLWTTHPGNPGIDALAQPCGHAWDPSNVYPLTKWCAEHGIDLVVVGPEQPLAEGVADVMIKHGIQVFGPTQAGAQLESDKAFAKELMRQAAIPTADSRTLQTANAALRWAMRSFETELEAKVEAGEVAFEPMLWWLRGSDDRGERPMPPLDDGLRDLLTSRDEPMVVKAAGLAAGKGVVVCRTALEAVEAIHTIMVDRSFGDAGERIIIEEMLEGQEASILALYDGETIWILDPCQDHKQVGEGDTGPNTGGMGAYCPTPVVDEGMLEIIERTVLIPLVDALRRNDIQYRGVIYAGMMLTPGGPKVLEFNCRFGDPECQPLMARFQGDLVDTLWRTATGTLVDADIAFDARHACCVVLCSEGYPGSYEKGRPIHGTDDIASDDLILFHAGTTRDASGALISSGGRVLSVTALDANLSDARQRANAALDAIHMPGGFYRRDIGHRINAAASLG